MVSALGIDPSLACLYREIKIPHAIGEKLKREHGITSLEKLVDQRLNLFEVVKRNISPDAARLLASVDFIIERKKHRDFAPTDSLFKPTKDPVSSFAYFVARDVETKGLHVQRLLPKKTGVSVRPKPKTGGKYWIVDEDEEDWKKDVVADTQEVDEEALRRELRIKKDDSPWTLDDNLRTVVLMKLPEAVRIPVPLFRKLYEHQRLGICWMADLLIDKTGGILGDEMGMGYVHTGYNSIVLRSVEHL